MENLFKLLVVLFCAVAVMVFALERLGSPVSEAQQARLSRWILPLVALLVVIQLFRHYFSG